MEHVRAYEASVRQGLTEAEIARLAKEHGRSIYRFILKKVRNPSDAEDLFQSTLCEALRVRATFMWQSKPETWLCGIAFNLIRNFFVRSDIYRNCFESEEVLDATPAEGQNPEEIIARNQVTHAIEQHMKALPKDMRDTLTLVAEKNHSYEEAAEAMGVPIGTVRSRIFRARAYLKKFGSHELLLG
jgi:RNA polymerase sigma factor (sigma-70 family)